MEDNKGEILKQMEVLSTMRNEIFAARGYLFRSAKWSRLFGREAWYDPRFEDVNDRLTETEKVNIAHLRFLEKRVRERMEETE